MEEQTPPPHTEIEPEPPKLVKNIKWLWLYGKENKGLVIASLVALLLLVVVLPQIKIFGSGREKDRPRPEVPNAELSKKSPLDATPDITQAKRAVLIVSRDQFVHKPELVDVSTDVPGYFEFTAPPAPGQKFSFSCVETKDTFSPNYFARARIAGMEGVNSLELKGLGVFFGIFASSNLYFIWESEENWTNAQRLTTQRHPEINALEIYQVGRDVSGFLNGKYLTTLRKLKTPEPGPISICFKADPKRGGRVHFQKLSIWEYGN